MPQIGAAPLNRHIRDTAGDLSRVPKITRGFASSVRYGVDILLAKTMNTVEVPRRDSKRSVDLTHGERLTYRLNRGDVQSIRDVFGIGCYDHPLPVAEVNTYVDLGANIGLTTLYFARRYHPEHIICVEPDPANAVLLSRNLAMNGVHAAVLEAAVGAQDGTARFARNAAANLGRVSDEGIAVPVLSMPSVLALLPTDIRVDLLKIDIEGAEQEVLAGPLDWLSRIDIIMVEIHADRADRSWCIATLASAGFEHIFGRDTDMFIRR